jgi:hypothetical protein
VDCISRPRAREGLIPLVRTVGEFIKPKPRSWTMLDTTPVTTAIAAMIRTGAAEPQILAAVVRRFPDLSPAELSQALQVATSAAERRAARRH